MTIPSITVSLLLILGFAFSSTAEIAPENVRATLQAGNERFLNNTSKAHNWSGEKVKKTGTFGQSPSVAVLTCSDSRTPVELIFDMGVGDMFVCRNAGGFDTPEVNATFEYGVAALGVHTLLVLGHTKCGAVTATLQGKPVPGNISLLIQSLRPGIEKIIKDNKDLSEEAKLNKAVEALTRYQMLEVLRNSELLTKAKADGKLQILSAIYDVETGKVRFLD